MKVENLSRKSKVLLFVCLLVFYFILQLKFINDPWFGTDELDIMVLGKSIARGKLLYVDVFSQHMPLSYYVSALFCRLGAVTVTEQRVAFYCLFALLWTIIFFRYADKIDYRVLIFYPVIHCCIIQNYEYGTSILSEHLAGIGAIILLSEFIVFEKERKINAVSCVMLSLSGVLTFGTIFVAVYPLFFMAMGVLLLELQWKKADRVGMKIWIKYMINKYYMLVIVMLVPWAVLIGYYICTHSMGGFINGAYTINRTIYSKYIEGLGENIFSTFFAPVEMLSSVFINGFNISEWTYSTVLQWCVILCSIIFIYRFIVEKGKIKGIALFLFTYSLGLRGIFHFHGTACVEVLSFMTAYVILVYGYKNWVDFGNKSFLGQGLLLFTVILIMSGYLQNISQLTNLSFQEWETIESKALKCITDSDEKVWCLTFDNMDAMLADRELVGATICCPWTWEGFGKKEYKKLKKHPPRVAIFSEEHDVWDTYKIKEYAPKAVAFVKEHYTKLPDTELIYVRKDYYEEACEKLKNNN